jgi:hypothetical protein
VIWAGNHANYDIMPLLVSFAQLYKNVEYETHTREMREEKREEI